MKLMVLDGNSLLNRAFYGIRLLSNSAGLYTNAVYGFLNILQKLLRSLPRSTRNTVPYSPRPLSA